MNDAGLLALRAGAPRPEPESPGLALFDEDALVVGAPAAAQARLKPRLVHDSFWDRLDTEPAGRPFREGVSRADLAHAHLRAIVEAAGGPVTEAYLAVPGFWSAEALGLLLGVARAAGLPVVGFVDAAVAAASVGHAGEALLHLDLTRHRSVVTAMVQGDEVARTRVGAAEGHGAKAFEELWAGAVASQFVREARFDPLHAGATEQALYDALPGWLGELGLRQSVPAPLVAAGREYVIELRRAGLLAAAADLYRGLAEQVGLWKRAGEATTILLSARAARLPAIAERLGEIRGVRVVELPLGAAVVGALEHRDRLRGEGEALPFVTRLPSGLSERERRAAPPVLVPHAPVSGARRPTHLLHEGTAHAIDARALFVGTAPPPGGRGLVLHGDTTGISRHHCTVQAADGEAVVEDHSSWGTFVNGERVAGRSVLHVGDRLRLGSPGVELLLIAVEE